FYDPFWSQYGLFGLAGINLLRIFNIPFYAFNEGWIPVAIKNTAIIEFSLSVIFLVVAGFVSLRKVILLRHHMKEIDMHEHNAL
ncbi:MAG: hypothetical protein JXB20_00785, partial [Bacilli bacterium]|nr:hypothetical protein [Bacilli bacterium]